MGNIGYTLHREEPELQRSIPDFRSIKEESEFWRRHSILDFMAAIDPFLSSTLGSLLSCGGER